MNDRAIHPDALTFVVREAMSRQRPCRDCSGGEVVLHETGRPGANWNLAVLTGGGCGNCLIALLPLLAELKRRYPIADFASQNRTLDLSEWMSFTAGQPGSR